MKKHILLFTNLAICLIIIVGFLCITFANKQTYEKILADDIENISRLTSATIYAEIDNELTKPIFVAQTMANDTFLKSWLRQEADNLQDSAHEKQLRDYLLAFKQKYGYDSVFMVSGESNRYYFFDGINKVVSPENAHDVWYYHFLEKNLPYTLNIDQDEANNNELTVFVDCRIEDDNGKLMGVVGVGVKMSQIQTLLQDYESEFDLSAFLVNREGLVQAHSDSAQIETMNIFDNTMLNSIRAEILSEVGNAFVYWYPENQLDNCLITRYIDNLDWYLVVEKNTEKLHRHFIAQLEQDFMLMLLVLSLLLFLSTSVIHWYNRLVMKMAMTDELTGLPNAKALNAAFPREVRHWKHKAGVLFIFDIDHFKQVNDAKGHLYGNSVLTDVGENVRRVVGKQGMVARWGGDEFAGVLYGTAQEAQALLAEMKQAISSSVVCALSGVQDDYTITISIGATIVGENESLTTLIEQADQALYISKGSGRDCTTYFQSISPLDKDEPEES